MRLSTAVWPVLVVAAVLGVTSLATQTTVPTSAGTDRAEIANDLSVTVEAVNAELQRVWELQQLAPAPAADELTVLRRLSLALVGAPPSLAEIRRFEADKAPKRLERWTASLLEDVRFADYFSERLTRAFVGVELGQFILFRRDRFKQWISQQLRDHRPYDEMIRDMIAGDGVWTDKAEVNFLTAAYANDDFDENLLAGRTVRVFLGQRIDCAQCHDHPFTHWKQSEFEGLAACFGQTRVSLVGVDENPEQAYVVDDRLTLKERTISPAVPFHSEWLPQEGSPRDRLAAWVAHPDNRRFERAIANRVWALLFGKPYLADVSVDDLPDPGDADTADETRMLDLLGRDFREHGCDLRRLIQVIAASKAFRMSSQHPAVDEQQFVAAECHWAVFPLVRLRPEQVIGSMLQASTVHTIDQNSHVFMRMLRFFRERDFIEEFGDPGENEMGERTGTIPQALLRMNGKLSQELTDGNPLNSTGRIATVAPTPEDCVEVCYLVGLTRRPTPEELQFFTEQIESQAGDRTAAVADLFWTLFNSPEFSWNH